MTKNFRNGLALILCFLFAMISLSFLGCGSQNENLSKGKELLKSDKRRKEERAVVEFKKAIESEPDNAEAHYLIGYYDENATVEERGEHMYLAYKYDKREYLKTLIYETLRVNDQDIVQSALFALKKAYDSGDKKPILNELEDAIKAKDSRDRYDAGLAFAYIGNKKDGDPKAVVPILIDLLKHKRMGTRLNAVLALGEIGDESAVEPIYNEIIIITDEKRKEDPEVRRIAVEALGKINTPSAIEKLMLIAENKGSSLRVDAIEVLAEVGGKEFIPVLKQILSEKGSKEAVVRI